ncbi:NYN domain [Bordetella ansorpii]|uniref:NYN domain n=1 Tax=Bordetella ansorpii TaxID=288768 RepID=A0A157Q4F2_9BORD|nr:NYN domain-containing protein [Bordetella ansorpii]SAI40627.1 NYN domain [Bordetella ansorpii]
MPTPQDSASMAVFCDFENLALGVRDANYARLDIRLVLERLLLKGSIVVKKAYCNWERYREFKEGMHEANFELIEIPHVRQSGKNSADIRLVVDALDLCYTKSHVDTFVIISGDSDFSPLVSKLRENAKRVIGVGVKRATSDLLVANCDEFIFYDDLERERRRAAEARNPVAAPPVAATAVAQPTLDEAEKRKRQALELIVQTFDALTTEEGDSQRIWASTLKNAIKRRKPDFSESYHGFKAFGHLLEEAQARGLLTLGRDERSGTYVSRAAAPDLMVRTEERKPRGARQGLAGQSGRRRGGAARNRSAEANIHADAAESRSNEDRALPNGSGQTPNAAAVTPAASGPPTRATDNGAAVSTPSAPETTNTNPPPRGAAEAVEGNRQSKTRRGGGARARAEAAKEGGAEGVAPSVSDRSQSEDERQSPIAERQRQPASSALAGVPIPTISPLGATPKAAVTEAAQAPAKPARKSVRKAATTKAKATKDAAAPAKAVKRPRAAKKAKAADES